MEDEGLRLKLYKCPAKKWSIGYGRNLEDVGIYQEEALFMLDNSIHKASDCLMSLPLVKHLNHNRRRVCVEMIYNLGFSGFLGFRQMRKAIGSDDFERAAVEILDSAAARDLPRRYLDFSDRMRKG